MNNMDLAYAAGLIDGEGCITIACTDAKYFDRAINKSYRLYLKVTMCDLETIQWLKDLFNTGSVQVQRISKKDQDKDWSTAWSWLCTTRQAEQVLRLIQPYLRAKKAEADLGIEFASLPISRKGGKGGSVSASPELIKRRHDLYIALHMKKSSSRRKGTKPKELSLIEQTSHE